MLVVFRLNLVFTFHLFLTHYLGDIFFVALHCGPGFLPHKQLVWGASGWGDFVPHFWISVDGESVFVPNFSLDGAGRDGAYLLSGEFLCLFTSFFTLREN